MDEAYKMLGYVLLGAVLGAIGQGIRIFIGLKKQSDAAADAGKKLEDVFSFKQLNVSIIIALVLGAIAGILGVILNGTATLDKNYMITIIILGYAGTDFVEGFIKTKMSPANIIKDKDISISG
jgi:hypothetical protein